MTDFVMETLTTDGWQQISSAKRYWRLEAKVDLDGTGWVVDPVWGGQGSLVLSRTVYVAGPSMADVPVAALACSAGTFAVVEDASGGVNVKVFRLSGSATVTLFLFSRRPPPDPGFGDVMWDASGTVIWSILTPILRPLGTLDNNGYAGLPLAGRSCAHIPQRRAFSNERIWTVGGLGSCTYTGTSGQPTQGYDVRYKDTETKWMVACSSASAAIDARQYTPTSASPFQCAQSPSTPGADYALQGTCRSLIIDVTNY